MNYVLYSGFLTIVEGYSYAFTLGGGVVTWKSSKQTLITTSTMKSEFITLNSTSEEVEWF